MVQVQSLYLQIKSQKQPLRRAINLILANCGPEMLARPLMQVPMLADELF